MKLILMGYPGSEKIFFASKYLIDKYLPEIEQHWLIYKGPLWGWSSFLAGYLKAIKDKNIMLALDDYLLAGPSEFDIEEIQFPEDVVCMKLCKSTQQEHEEYPVTTQYAIWDREFLINLLFKTTSPWDFEMSGSKLFPSFGKKSVLLNCLPYDVHSCLSNRWEGIKLDGLKEEDIKEINKLL